MQAVNDAIATFGDTFWTWLLIPLLTLVSIYFTVRLVGVQFRLVPEMFRTIANPAGVAPDGKKAVSSFQAFSISAAARIGTGNVVGVAGAIAVGGPGAVFWMWVMALLVGATSFVESTLGQVYKVKDPTGYRGGPAYYILHGLGSRWAAVLYAVTILLTFSMVFTSVQSNTFAQAIGTSWETAGAGSVPGWLYPVIGLILVAMTSAVIFGGVRRIAHVTQMLVPFMALIYIVMAIVVVAVNLGAVPDMLATIVTSAFGFEQVAGATLGTVIVEGVRRGMFSNEAGLGSAPNAGATASVTHPVKQGLVQTLGVYFDTLIVSTSTAFLILVSNPTFGAERGPAMTQDALETSLGTWSLHLLTLVLILLTFSSVLGNYYYGEANITFLSEDPRVLTAFKLVFLIPTMGGAIGSVQLVWTMADTTMGLMALVNLVAITPLAGVVLLVMRDYQEQSKQGLDPVFTRDRLPQLRGLQVWETEDLPAEQRR